MGRTSKRGTSKNVALRLTDLDLKRVDRARVLIGEDSRNAFARRVVLEKLDSIESTKIVDVRDVSEPEAIRLIARYLRQHHGTHDTSDLADRLGIELGAAFAASQKLIENGRAKVGTS